MCCEEGWGGVKDGSVTGQVGFNFVFKLLSLSAVIKNIGHTVRRKPIELLKWRESLVRKLHDLTTEFPESGSLQSGFLKWLQGHLFFFFLDLFWTQSQDLLLISTPLPDLVV